MVPQGGNTGLVGGSVPVHDEIVISTGKMNKIEKFDPTTSVVFCESGVILQNLQEYLADYKYMPPVSLGSKGSCQIGGNLATNVGGIKFLKYNSLHAN